MPPSATGSTDLVRQYLQDIGRVDLLNAEQELILARLVQRRQSLLEQQRDDSTARSTPQRCLAPSAL